MKLPKPNTTPLGRNAVKAALPKREMFALDSVLKDTDIYFLDRTFTRVDVGSWLMKRRILACVTESDLVLLAGGRRPFVDIIPISNLNESQYNHVTGEVALAPAPGIQISGLKMEPLKAMVFLAQIHKE